jgi:asparagine synthase (glutamine-hydrolysing)
MSVQFGRWNPGGEPAGREYLDQVSKLLAPYGPDCETFYAASGVNILYRAFYLTKECRRESQPHGTASGLVITWDGRLDNRKDLVRRLCEVVSADSPDVSIVAAAYERWGMESFKEFLGDWALSVWNPNERSLVLAKDPIGTRHLYYAVARDLVLWSTILDPLVRFQGETPELDREYLAGWFSFFPAAGLTPYVGIHSVPPASYVVVQGGEARVQIYWDFDASRRVRYRTDAEYEEHFRAVFFESVERRLRADAPVLAELSGGMDSSSVVSVADFLIARGCGATSRLDTLSYYNDSEPNWNERPYFTRVEERRGRTGCHIDISGEDRFELDSENDGFQATPGSGRRPSGAVAKRFRECVASQGNRVVLSGIGGDEVLGGVPTPLPELEDLLARARFKTLAHQLKVWALEKRKPWWHLLFEAVHRFLPPTVFGAPRYRRPPTWLDPRFARRYKAALTGYPCRVELLGPLPSFQESIQTLAVLRRQLGCFPLESHPPMERRYPYLDRSLLEFLYAIPRNQLLRPGQRRSLMRRALIGIVPDQILRRKRKAFVARAPIVAIQKRWPQLATRCEEMVASSIGIVSAKEFTEALENSKCGGEVSVVHLMRTIAIENWLGNLARHGALGRSAGNLNRSERRDIRTESSLVRN